MDRRVYTAARGSSTTGEMADVKVRGKLIYHMMFVLMIPEKQLSIGLVPSLNKCGATSKPPPLA